MASLSFPALLLLSSALLLGLVAGGGDHLYPTLPGHSSMSGASMHMRNCSDIPNIGNLPFGLEAVCVPAGAYVPRLDHISRNGWTATATEAASPAPGPAKQLSSTPVPLRGSQCWQLHTSQGQLDIVLNMTTVQPIAGVTVSPCSGVAQITEFVLHVSADGQQWGDAVAMGVWADDNSQGNDAFTEFYAVHAQYVRISARVPSGTIGLKDIRVQQLGSQRTEVGEHPTPAAPAASAHPSAPVAHTFKPTQLGGILGGGTPGTSVGQWGPTINFPVLPAAVAVLPNNQLVMWSAYLPNQWTGSPIGYTQTALLNLSTLVSTASTVSNTYHEMFCPGISLLADGKLLINGGSNGYSSSIWDFATQKWTPTPWLNIPRGYQSAVTLDNGNVFTIGGSFDNGIGGKTGELWNLATQQWTILPGAPANPIYTNDPSGVYRSDNHAWLFAFEGGWVLQAGPSKTMNWFNTNGAGSYRRIGLRADSADAMNGNAVMYDAVQGLILTVGGATSYDQTHGLVNATPRSYIVQTSGANQSVTVTRSGDLAYYRTFANSVVLPDGSVLVTGGQQQPVPFTDTKAVMPAELWSPTTGTFTTLASLSVPRTYHSVSIMLPDATVFVGGGGLCDNACNTNHPSGQIFTPPYLLNSDGSLRTRPTILSAPTSATPGQSIAVTTSSLVSSFSLVRYDGATHAVHTDQRRIPLSASLGLPTNLVLGVPYSLTLPSTYGVLTPGWYMLFAIDSNGTPSPAANINIPLPLQAAPAQVTGFIQYQTSGYCLQQLPNSAYVGLAKCNANTAAQKWTRDPATATLRNAADQSQCMAVGYSVEGVNQPFVMQACQGAVIAQQITYTASTSHWTVAGHCLSLYNGAKTGPAGAVPKGAPAYPTGYGQVLTQACNAGGVNGQQFQYISSTA